MVSNGYYNSGATANASPLQNLTQDLGKNVQILTDYLRSAGLEQPSWDRHTPATVLPPDAPKDIQIAKELLMDQALQILQLASGPTEYLANVITGVSQSRLGCSRRCCASKACFLTNGITNSTITWRACDG